MGDGLLGSWEVTVAFVVVAVSAVVVFTYRLLQLPHFSPSLSFYSSSTSSTSSSSPKSSLSSPSSSLSSSSSSSPLLPMSIFFGSQSGTAEAFARELSGEGRLFGFQATVKDLEEYDFAEELTGETYAVFLMATFGEGEPTDNAASFYHWLCSEGRSAEEMGGVRYSVFALGNRQYEHFCVIGRKVDERMKELGGERVAPLGEGDDDGSLEGDFRAWKTSFWELTSAAFGTSSSNESTEGGGGSIGGGLGGGGGFSDGFPRSVPPPPRFISAFQLLPLPSTQVAAQRLKYIGGLSSLVTDPKHRVVIAPVVENRELRQSVEDEGSTRHIELDLSAVSLPYVTADNCGVYPRNDYKTVSYLMKRLQLDGSDLVLMKGNGSKRPFLPSPCSVQDIFLYYLDITFSPRLSQLPLFTHYCADDRDKALLLYWARQGGVGSEEYLGDQKTFVELLEELPSLLPPLSDVVDFIPHVSPRFYTISSSSLVQPKRLSLTVSVLTHHKPRGRKQRGLCSGYLASLRPEKDSVAIFIRPSSFRLPKPRPSLSNLPSTTSPPPPLPLPPVLMVGPGTGVAPFRGFVQEATTVKLRVVSSNGSSSPSSSTVVQPQCGYGDLILFFGCRSSTKDFIYKEELLHAVQQGILTQLHVAFSREQQQTAPLHGDTVAPAAAANDAAPSDDDKNDVGDPPASELSVSSASTAATTASLAAASSLKPETSRPLTVGAVGRVYVQDRMRGVGDTVWDAIHTRKGHLFVCGGTAMGRAVREVLIDCCKERGGMTDKQAEIYIKKMQEQKRYIQELWS